MTINVINEIKKIINNIFKDKKVLSAYKLRDNLHFYHIFDI